MVDVSTPKDLSKSAIFKRRLTSTVILWGLVTAIFLSQSTIAFMAGLGILSMLGLMEYFRMMRAASVPCFPRFGMMMGLVYLLVVGVISYRAGRASGELWEMLGLVVLVIGAIVAQLRHEIKGVEPWVAVAVTVMGWVWIPVMFQYATKVVYVAGGVNEQAGHVGEKGAYLLIWLLAVTKFSDMGAYVTGSLIGKHKMIPHVSPGKTWEGFGGAIFFSTLVGYGMYVGFPQQLAVLGGVVHVVVLGVLLSVLAVLGDLAESLVKRALGAKDSGQILPGIGGALDLMDSICFTAPVLYYYLYFLHQ